MKNRHSKDIYVKEKYFPAVFDMVQYDTGNEIEFIIKDLAIPPGAIAKSFFRKPSGKFVYDDISVVITGNKVLIPVLNQSIAEIGTTMMQVNIIAGDDTISTFGAKINVERSYANETAEQSRTIVNAFDLAVADAVKKIGDIIDPTLSIPNKAADASAVGDAIHAIHDIEDIHTLEAIIDAIFADGVADYPNGNLLTIEQLQLIIDNYLRVKSGNDVNIGETLKLDNGDVVYTSGNKITAAIKNVFTYLNNKISTSGGFILNVLRENILGGARAKPKTDEDTQEVHVDENGFLWTKSGDGGNPYPSERVVYLSPVVHTGDSINATIRILESKGGGDIYLDCGIFSITEPIVINGTVNIHGSGVRNTIIRASLDNRLKRKCKRTLNPSSSVITEVEYRTMIVLEGSARNVILENFTLDGNRWTQNVLAAEYKYDADEEIGAEVGLFVPDTTTALVKDYSYHFASDPDVKSDVSNNKTTQIRNVCFYGCDCGAYIGNREYSMQVYSCYFAFNGTGLVAYASDCMYDKLEIMCNKFHGAIFEGANCKINTLKIFCNSGFAWTGKGNYCVNNVDDKNMRPWRPLLLDSSSQTEFWNRLDAVKFGSRLNVANVEIQDNYGDPCSIVGDNTIVTGLIVDDNAYRSGNFGNNTNETLKTKAIKISGSNNIIIATITRYNANNAHPIYTGAFGVTSNSVNNKAVLTYQDGTLQNNTIVPSWDNVGGITVF